MDKEHFILFNVIGIKKANYIMSSVKLILQFSNLNLDNVMIKFILNGNGVSTRVPDDTPLLWVIRDEFHLKGTKFGCGISRCGACTVHIDGDPVRTCNYPVKLVNKKQVTTIEGLNNEHPLQQAWIKEQVPQCGYCQSGQIMQAATLLASNNDPSEKEIVSHMNNNLCRCMAYERIKKAIKTAANATSETVSIFDPASNGQKEN